MIQVLVSLPLQVQVHGRQCWKLWVIPLVKFEFQWKRGPSGGCCDGFLNKDKSPCSLAGFEPKPMFLHSSFLTSPSQPCCFTKQVLKWEIWFSIFPSLCHFYPCFGLLCPFERRSGTLEQYSSRLCPKDHAYKICYKDYTAKHTPVCKQRLEQSFLLRIPAPLAWLSNSKFGLSLCPLHHQRLPISQGGGVNKEK